MLTAESYCTVAAGVLKDWCSKEPIQLLKNATFYKLISLLCIYNNESISNIILQRK